MNNLKDYSVALDSNFFGDVMISCGSSNIQLRSWTLSNHVGCVL